jgi:hypothetical protein
MEHRRTSQRLALPEAVGGDGDVLTAGAPYFVLATMRPISSAL